MKPPVRQTLLLSSLASAVAFITACGGGGGSSSAPPSYSMQVTGLASGATLSITTAAGQTIDVRQNGSASTPDLDTKRWSLSVKPDNQVCGISANGSDAQIECKSVGVADGKLWMLPQTVTGVMSAIPTEDGSTVIAMVADSTAFAAVKLIKLSAAGAEDIATLPPIGSIRYDGITRLPNGNLLVHLRNNGTSGSSDFLEVSSSGVVTPYNLTGDYVASRGNSNGPAGQTSSIFTLDDGRVLVVKNGWSGSKNASSLHVIDPQTKQVVKVMQSDDALLRPVFSTDGKVYVAALTNDRVSIAPTFTGTVHLLARDNTLSVVPNVQPVQGMPGTSALGFNVARVGTDPNQWLLGNDPSALKNLQLLPTDNLCSGITVGQWGPAAPVASGASAPLLNFVASQTIKGGKAADGTCTLATESAGLYPFQNWTLVSVDGTDGAMRHYLADLHFHLKPVSIPPYTHNLESRFSVAAQLPYLGGQVGRKMPVQVIKLSDPLTGDARFGMRVLKLQ